MIAMGIMTVWRLGPWETGSAALSVSRADPGDRPARPLTKIHKSELRSCQERMGRAAREVSGRCMATRTGQ